MKCAHTAHSDRYGKPTLKWQQSPLADVNAGYARQCGTQLGQQSRTAQLCFHLPLLSRFRHSYNIYYLVNNKATKSYEGVTLTDFHLVSLTADSHAK